MSTIRRIAKNTISLFLAHFTTLALSLILSIIIARELGNINFGKYSFAISYVAFFSIFSDMGYNTLMIRDVARNKSHANKYLSNILFLRIIVSVIVFTLIAISINLLDQSRDTRIIVYIFGLYTLITAISDVFRIIYQSFEKMEYDAITRTISTLIRVSLCLVSLHLGYGLIVISLAFLVSGVFDILLTYKICKSKFIRPYLEFDANFLKDTIKIAIPLGMLSFYGIIYVRADTIMLSMMKGDATVGWYNAAYNLILGFKPFPKLLFNVLFPLMSTYYISSTDLLKTVYEKSFKFLFMIGLPLAVGITLLANQIITIAYGKEFHNSIIVLQILAWDVLLIFSYTPIAGLLVSTHNEKKMNIFAGTTALLNISLNIVLIPSYSYVGAAVSTVLSETLLFILYFHSISSEFHRLNLRKTIIHSIIASITMGIFIHSFHQINLYLIIILAIVIYFTVFFTIGGISNDEINLLKQLYNKKQIVGEEP